MWIVIIWVKEFVLYKELISIEEMVVRNRQVQVYIIKKIVVNFHFISNIMLENCIYVCINVCT